jgi:hypothetical protein
MTRTGRGSARSGKINLALMVPALPVVGLPNGKEVQLVALTAEGYELYREIQAIIREEQDAIEAGEEPATDVAGFHDMLDRCLAIVLPTATRDDLASLGVRVQVKLAPLMAAAGQVDTVLEALAALDPEGNGRTARNSPRSGLGTASGLRSKATPAGTAKGGKRSTGARASQG